MKQFCYCGHEPKTHFGDDNECLYKGCECTCYEHDPHSATRVSKNRTKDAPIAKQRPSSGSVFITTIVRMIGCVVLGVVLLIVGAILKIEWLEITLSLSALFVTFFGPYWLFKTSIRLAKINSLLVNQGEPAYEHSMRNYFSIEAIDSHLIG